MKTLKVDLAELAYLMESYHREDPFYLDIETGNIVSVSGEVIEAIEDNELNSFNSLPDWQKSEVEEGKQILKSIGDRYIEIPEALSFEGYNLMEQFIRTTEDPLSSKLNSTIRGSGAFRRFKEVLRYYPQEEKRWYEFHDEHMKNEAIQWLNEIGVSPDLSLKEQ